MLTLALTLICYLTLPSLFLETSWQMGSCLQPTHPALTGANKWFLDLRLRTCPFRWLVGVPRVSRGRCGDSVSACVVLLVVAMLFGLICLWECSSLGSSEICSWGQTPNHCVSMSLFLWEYPSSFLVWGLKICLFWWLRVEFTFVSCLLATFR